MESVLRQLAPSTPVIHLLSDAPTDPQLCSYLLAALRHCFPPTSIFLAVVDPGVGGARKPLVLKADGQYFVGPDNSLLNTVAVQSKQTDWWEITYRPDRYSATFHGRDIFAPVAAHLANGSADRLLKPMEQPFVEKWRPDLHAIIYFDHYGNAMTGIRHNDSFNGQTLTVGEHTLKQAETFCSVLPAEPFWYCNSIGLIEIAVNRGRAQQRLHLHLGDTLHWE
jgi:S-adenosylmethionine hydrolase